MKEKIKEGRRGKEEGRMKGEKKRKNLKDNTLSLLVLRSK